VIVRFDSVDSRDLFCIKFVLIEDHSMIPIVFNSSLFYNSLSTLLFFQVFGLRMFFNFDGVIVVFDMVKG